MRTVLANVMPYPQRFRLALVAAWLGKPFAPVAEAVGLEAACRDAPACHPGGGRTAPLAPQTFPAAGSAKGRVALLAGCVNDVLAPQINAAAIRAAQPARRSRWSSPKARAAAARWSITWAASMRRSARRAPTIDALGAVEGLDAIVITASGCGTTVKDYGFMLRTDPAYAERAARISSLARDISEYLAGLPIKPEGDAAKERTPLSSPIIPPARCSTASA